MLSLWRSHPPWRMSRIAISGASRRTFSGEGRLILGWQASPGISRLLAVFPPEIPLLIPTDQKQKLRTRPSIWGIQERQQLHSHRNINPRLASPRLPGLSFHFALPMFSVTPISTKINKLQTRLSKSPGRSKINSVGLKNGQTTPQGGRKRPPNKQGPRNRKCCPTRLATKFGL
ncbi:uncharacterized protein LY89DRAFT_310975 [Mollisia scopiformis]|uniref:Uncharacterized protein n=1 Tax=Mollisia scopiformis TaxID=149040 RepID=A0A194XSV1_MOLSC|nr:uncharacterized protein LY89DRAFT_310975 [Mollisia scopiformis]KUJ22807.1 hypothetical protein LY89DRAFT_310975 [Mollisia scopiformis]